MSVLASSGTRLASETCWLASSFDGCGRGYARRGRRKSYDIKPLLIAKEDEEILDIITAILTTGKVL